MPNKDGKGPLGQGPVAGRGAGRCRGAGGGQGGGGQGCGARMRGGVRILAGESELLKRREQELAKELETVRARLRKVEKGAADGAKPEPQATP